MMSIRRNAWFFFQGDKAFALSMLAACILLLAQMYLNTGTLSAYAVTLENPFLREGYIVNYDYAHYECNYHFIMGDHADHWAWGWVLRRILFYILSYPWFCLFGFYQGGLLSAFILTLVAFYSFVRFAYRQLGRRAAYVCMALLATYPGIMYWIGSPFAQVMIVPCCCWLYMLMWHMQRTGRFMNHLAYLVLASILFTAYDLFALFYPAILLLYARRRQWKFMLLSLPVMVVPQLLIGYWLDARGAGVLKTENSGLYMGILQSYLHPHDFRGWWELLAEAPLIFLHNFFCSGFWLLPLTFLLFWIFGSYRKAFRLNDIERYVLLMALLVFLFNNLAPPYELGTSLRGYWIARIYQPVFVVMMVYIARLSEQLRNEKTWYTRASVWALALCLCFNLAVNTGGVFASPLTQRVWYTFYQHAKPGTMRENLAKYGVRPLGFPDESAR